MSELNEVIEVHSIDRKNYKQYIGKTVRVTGDVDLSGLGLVRNLPMNFTEVGGNFWCQNNYLNSLVGSPKVTRKEFDCSFNRMTSLKGAPVTVGGDFFCENSELTSLDGAPRIVRGSFYCKYNRLNDLKGAPEIVGQNFDCRNNPMQSIVDKPTRIGGKFFEVKLI